MWGTSLDPFDKSGCLKIGHVTLDLSGTEARPIRQRPLAGKGFALAIPSEFGELHQYRELRRVELQPVLRSGGGIPFGTTHQRSGQDCKVSLDNPDHRYHLALVIAGIRHKALRRYWTRGHTRGLNGEWIGKLRRILSALEAAERPEHMNYPGSYFHALQGDRAGRYAVRLTANWRVTFGLAEDSAVDVDMEDYHQ